MTRGYVKRALGLLLALLMMAGLLAGCGDSGEETSTTPDSDATSSLPSYEPVETPDTTGEFQLPLTEDEVVFEWWHPDGGSFEGYSSTYDNVFYQWLQEKTGVTIEFVNPASSGATEAFQAMLLSQDYSDFVSGVRGYYVGGVDKAISDGFLQRLNDLASQYMPNYLATVYRDEDTFIQSVSDSGNLWGIHCILDRKQDAWVGTCVRSDWLEDIGKTAADVETIDGLEEVLVEFKELTTDNVGPLFLSGSSFQPSHSLNGSWNVTGVNHMSFMNKDGQAVYSALEPGFKEYVAKMADWYAKGLVNKNYIAENVWITNHEIWARGETGVADGQYSERVVYQQLNAASDVPDPDFDIIAIPSPKLDASQDWATDQHVRQAFDVVRPSNSVGITTTCNDIEIACKFWDFVFTEEGTIASNWGPYVGEVGDQNASYFIDETDADGDGHIEMYQPWLTETYGNIANVMTKFCVWNNAHVYIWDREMTALGEHEQEMERTWAVAGSDWLWPDGVTLTAEEGEKASAIVTPCNTQVSTWAAEVITGEKSVDTYETELVPFLMENGIEEAIAYYQTALSRYHERAQFMED